MQSKTLPNLREAEPRVLDFLFPGYSKEGLMQVHISFQVSQFKNFLGSYAEGLTELSPK